MQTSMRTLGGTERMLRRLWMPEDEIDAVLAAGDPETVRRYFELHRERLQEQLDERRRALDILEALLARRSREGLTR
jgi:hypothetical protein